MTGKAARTNPDVAVVFAGMFPGYLLERKDSGLIPGESACREIHW